MSDTVDTLSTKEKLNLETAKLSWKELELFFAKGNLLKVSEKMDLIDVAATIADNDKEKLESLIKDELIEFATPEWVRENCQDVTPFWTVVVAPYVICQKAS